MKLLKTVLALMLVFMLVLCTCGCLKYTSNILEVTSSNSSNNPYLPSSFTPDGTTVPVISDNTTGLQGEITTINGEAPVTQVPATQSPSDTPSSVTPENTTAASADPASWSKTQMLQTVTSAVNKTKAYVGNLSVTHKEVYNFDITECPGGSLVRNIINSAIGNFVKPTDETLNFSGGKATDSDGEPIVLLLPSKQSFALTEAGITSISAKKSGNNTEVSIVLVGETGTLTTPPKHNAAAIGYLDVASLGLSGITINSFDVNYTGSKLTAIINPEGYLVSGAYDVPFVINASGSVSIASGNVKANGNMIENWIVNW